MPNQPSQFLIGVDIGGTFTDIVVVDQASGKQFNGKVLTTLKIHQKPFYQALMKFF